MALLFRNAFAAVFAASKTAQFPAAPLAVRLLHVSQQRFGGCGKEEIHYVCPVPKKRYPDVLEHVLTYTAHEDGRVLAKNYPDKGGRSKEFCKWAEEVLHGGLSSMALLGGDSKGNGGCVVGVGLAKCVRCKDVMDIDLEHHKDSSPDELIRQVKRMFLYVHQKLNLFQHFGVQELVCMQLLTEDHDHKGKGICQHLLKKSAECAVHKEFKAMKADCISQNMSCCCKKMMGEVFHMKFDDYKVKGEVVFCDTKAPNDTLRTYAGHLCCEDPFLKPVTDFKLKGGDKCGKKKDKCGKKQDKCGKKEDKCKKKDKCQKKDKCK